MAVRFDASTDRLHYIGTLPNPAATGLTILGWWRVRVDVNNYQTYYRTSGADGTPTIHSIATDFSEIDVNVYTPTGFIENTYLNSVDEWIAIAVVDTGAGVTQYVRPADGSTLTNSGSVASGAPGQICIGGRSQNDSSETLNGNAAYVRIFAGSLTQAQVEAEWNSSTPLITSSLFADYPLLTAADIRDHSGNGRHLTAGSTPVTTEDGPPIVSHRTRFFAGA